MPTASTWGKLRDTSAPARVRFRFPWEDADTEATYARPGYASGTREVEDGDPVELWVHFIDYGGEIGVQETMFPVTAPVELFDDSTPAAPATGTTTTGAQQ